MSETQNQSSGVRYEFGNVVVEKINPGLSETSDSAQLRQTVKSIYPGARANSSLSDALFPSDSFGGSQEFESSRVAFVKVPKGTTQAQAQAALSQFPNARIYRIMSLDFKDCMTDEQKQAIDMGINPKGWDDYKSSLKAVHPETGEALLYQGREFYRATYFSQEPVEDVDLRPEQIAAEEGGRIELVASKERPAVRADF